MSDKLIGATTLVTETRTYLIDSVSKKGMKRSSVSARSNKVTQQDVEVTLTQPHIITKHSNKYLQIATTFPVRAVFIPGVPEVETPPKPGTTYTDGIIYAEDTVDVTESFIVSVYDPDVVAKTLQVTVFNSTTGETEFLTLDRLPNGLYQGTLRLMLCLYKGEDFDGIMQTQPGDNLRVIYQDGRGADGEPKTIIHNTKVTSAFTQPELRVRRAVTLGGLIGISLSGTSAAPVVTVKNTRTGEYTTVVLTANGSHFHADVDPVARLSDVQMNDVLTVEHVYADLFGAQVVTHASCTIGRGETIGILKVPAIVKQGDTFLLELDDPDVVSEYVDVVISGDQSSDYERIRLLSEGRNTGRYSVLFPLSMFFEQDLSLTVTYADSSSGTPKLVKLTVLIDRATAPEVSIVVLETPTINVVEQMAMQMEINGLFVLNGQFSGIIKLYAAKDEVVRCSIIQAS